jgi:hypothetical protein
MFKLVSNFFGYLFLLFLLASPLLLPLAAYLIWKGSGKVRGLGWLLLLLIVYYQLSWISPWLVTRGGNRVQEFKLNELPFGSNPSVRWMDTPPRLLLVPDEKTVFIPEPPEYNHVLVVDLEGRKAHWQPKAEVNFDGTRRIEFLDAVSPLKVEARTEYNFVGFSVPIPSYSIPWVFRETSGWQWEKTYFGLVRNVVRESEPGSAVVELNQIVFNSPRNLSGAKSVWVMDGKFLIVEPLVYIDRRVLVVGPFNTSQDTQSTNNKNKE